MNDELERAKAALAQGDKRAAMVSLWHVLNADINNEEAWHIVHSIVRPAAPFDAFRQEYASKYFPNQAHLLSARLPAAAPDLPISPPANNTPAPNRPPQPVPAPAPAPVINASPQPPAYRPPASIQYPPHPARASGGRAWLSKKTIFIVGFLALALLVFLLLSSNDPGDSFTVSAAKPVYQPAISADGRWMALQDESHMVSIWNLDTRTQTASINIQFDSNIFKLSNNGAYLITGFTSEVKVWNSLTGELAGTYAVEGPARRTDITDAAISPDNRYIFMTTDYGWDYRNITNPFEELKYSYPEVNSSVSFSPTGKFVTITDQFNKITTYQFPEMRATFGQVEAFSPDDSMMVERDYNDKAIFHLTSIYGADAGPSFTYTLQEELGASCSGGSAEFSLDGKTLYLSCYAGYQGSGFQVRPIDWQTGARQPVQNVSVPSDCYIRYPLNLVICRSSNSSQVKVYHPGAALRPGLARSAQAVTLPPRSIYAAAPSGDEQMVVDQWFIERQVAQNKDQFRNIRYQTAKNQDGYAEVHVTYEQLSSGLWLGYEGTARLRLLQGKWNLDESSMVFQGDVHFMETVTAKQQEAGQGSGQQPADPANTLGGTLVYVLDEKIHVRLPDGSTRVLDPVAQMGLWNNAHLTHPTLTPDGKGVYFAAERISMNSGIYYTSLDGSEAYAVEILGPGGFSLSPDGQYYVAMSQYGMGAYAFNQVGEHLRMNWTDNLPDALGGAAWSTDSRTFYQVIAGENDARLLVAVDMNQLTIQDQSGYRSYLYPPARSVIMDLANRFSEFSTDYPLEGYASPNGKDLLFPNYSNLVLIDTRAGVANRLDTPQCGVARWLDDNWVMLMTKESHIFYRYNVQTGERQDVGRLDVPLSWDCDNMYDWAP